MSKQKSKKSRVFSVLFTFSHLLHFNNVSTVSPSHSLNVIDLNTRVTKSYNTSQTQQTLKKTMDVTFVLEESGVTATVEVPCEADAAAAKEVACTALAVSPASVEMRIGTQVLEGTSRLQDTAFDSGVQVVLARRFADIKCPAECSVEALTGLKMKNLNHKVSGVSLSPCGALCLFTQKGGYVTGLDTDTFIPAFKFKLDIKVCGAPAISRCKTRCYLARKDGLHEVALPGGEVLRKVEGPSYDVFACGGVVVSQGKDGVSVYDEDLTLLRTLSHEVCWDVAGSHCGGWVITSSCKEHNARLWNVNTGEAVACVPTQHGTSKVALSRSASIFAVGSFEDVHLCDWSGAALSSFKEVGATARTMQFTPCGKYLLVDFANHYAEDYSLHQYDVATMSCVRVLPVASAFSFAISPCSRVVVANSGQHIVTKHLYPY